MFIPRELFPSTLMKTLSVCGACLLLLGAGTRLSVTTTAKLNPGTPQAHIGMASSLSPYTFNSPVRLNIS